MFWSLELHVTFWFVALVGLSVAVNVSLRPNSMVVAALLSEMPVTDTAVARTETVQEAVLLPSTAVTVMVADPVFTPVISPAGLTVTTRWSLELHVTFLLVALAGLTIATRLSLPLTTINVSPLLSDTPVTAMTAALG